MADQPIQHGVIKILDVVGVSQESFSDAVRQAVRGASKTVRGITGVEVTHSSAKVSDGEITEYHVSVRLAFPVEGASD